MLDFKLWAWNGRIFPGIDPLVARLGDTVRLRAGKPKMTNHPIHLHGHEFTVTGTDGGPVPRSARWPEVTTDIAVGQRRQIEFVADEPGDWALHCHKSDPTMRAIGHAVPMMTGQRPFRSVVMGGRFSVLKVRAGLGADDRRDPGWHAHPQGHGCARMDRRGARRTAAGGGCRGTASGRRGPGAQAAWRSRRRTPG